MQLHAPPGAAADLHAALQRGDRCARAGTAGRIVPAGGARRWCAQLLAR